MTDRELWIAGLQLLVLFLLAAFCCVMFGRVLVSFSAWVMS